MGEPISKRSRPLAFSDAKESTSGIHPSTDGERRGDAVQELMVAACGEEDLENGKYLSAALG